MKKWNFTVSKFVVFMLLAVLLTGCGLKEKKAVTAGSVVAPVTGTVGIKMNVTSPVNVNQIYIERKETSEPETKWKQVGFKHFSSMRAEIATDNFTDYFYEKGKTYEYRARFNTNNYSKVEYATLGKISNTPAGWSEPCFNPVPSLDWNSSERTLSITNEPHLMLPENDVWNSVSQIDMGFTYFVPGEDWQGEAYPYFVLDCNNPHTVEDWDDYSWNRTGYNIGGIFVDIYLGDDVVILPRLTIYDTSNGMNIGSIPSWAIANLN